MKAIRLWSVRNAGRLKKCYAVMEGTLGETGMAFRMEDRIGEIVIRSNALGGRKPWRPAP
tara:strand:+ start:307 stop:486 length:180 start_codon:yes stop_codon:yes gene_type:complete